MFYAENNTPPKAGRFPGLVPVPFQDLLGALRDTGELDTASSDIKPDRHTCRVLGRLRLGQPWQIN